MKELLLTYNGRINRSKVWLAMLYYIGAAIAVGILCYVLAQIIPGESEDGGYDVTGIKALPFIVLIVGYIGLAVWSGICVGIKRYHDRNKPGLWVLIQFVPIIGGIWYFVEVFCLRGTVGPNTYGPDPLG